MNSIINQYIIKNFSKVIFVAILIFFCLGVILNLFEEIDFFKKHQTDFLLPIILTLSLLPNLIVELLPFIIFLSSIWYLISIKDNKDLLSLKVFGLSNLKIASMTALLGLLIGLIVIVAVNPVTASLIQFYETTKAKYSNDVNHLISFNKNGIWIKDEQEKREYIINASKLEGDILKNIIIYEFDENNFLNSRVDADSANIKENLWIIYNVRKYNFQNLETIFLKNLNFQSTYNLNRINSIYKNTNTLSFFNLVNNFALLKARGYNEDKLIEKIHKLLSLPIYLFLMVLLAASFVLTKQRSKNKLQIVVLAILTCVALYYLNHLSMVLGQTGKIGLVLSVWMPIIILSIISTVTIIQINEK